MDLMNWENIPCATKTQSSPEAPREPPVLDCAIPSFKQRGGIKADRPAAIIVTILVVRVIIVRSNNSTSHRK